MILVKGIAYLGRVLLVLIFLFFVCNGTHMIGVKGIAYLDRVLIVLILFFLFVMEHTWLE